MYIDSKIHALLDDSSVSGDEIVSRKEETRQMKLETRRFGRLLDRLMVGYVD